jgi:hypothetical protein
LIAAITLIHKRDVGRSACHVLPLGRQLPDLGPILGIGGGNKWVGTGRGASIVLDGLERSVSPSPPLPPYVRLSPHTATAYQDLYPHFLSTDIDEASHVLAFGVAVL